MKVRRHSAIELDNGDIQVSITIAASDRDEFFGIAPIPGTEFVIAPLVVRAAAATAQKPPAQVAQAKPPTQTVAPAGGAPGPVGGSAMSRDAQSALVLCDNPWFQQFAAESTNTTGDFDAVVCAKLFVKSRCLQGALWDSDATIRYQALVVDYTAWCAKKGYR